MANPRKRKGTASLKVQSGGNVGKSQGSRTVCKKKRKLAETSDCEPKNQKKIYTNRDASDVKFYEMLKKGFHSHFEKTSIFKSDTVSRDVTDDTFDNIKEAEDKLEELLKSSLSEKKLKQGMLIVIDDDDSGFDCISSELESSDCDSASNISSTDSIIACDNKQDVGFLHVHVGSEEEFDQVSYVDVPCGIPDKSKYVAIDCEMVGVGKNKQSALGRCTIIDYNGHVLLDVYSKPREVITDYRTPWSGIRSSDMVNALPFEIVQEKAKRILHNKIVVGHSVDHDFQSLKISHPAHSIRDIARYKHLKGLAQISHGGPVSLKKLSLLLLGYRIQRGEHCSLEDARATMELFKLVQKQWEEDINGRREHTCISDDSMDNKSPGENSCNEMDIGNLERRTNDQDLHTSASYLADEFWPDDLGDDEWSDE